MAVSAVIAAAGLSARMRDFKPLFSLGGSTIIHHAVDVLRTVGAAPILVVTGYQSAVLERHLVSKDVMFLKNERFAQTDMLTSLQLGLNALPSDTERVFLSPADVPLVSSDTLRQMLAVTGQVVCPLYQGRQGHPLLVDQEAVRQILHWEGPGGLRGLLDTGALETVRIETGDPGIRMDADTPEDYQRLLQYQARLRGTATCAWISN